MCKPPPASSHICGPRTLSPIIMVSIQGAWDKIRSFPRQYNGNGICRENCEKGAFILTAHPYPPPATLLCVLWLEMGAAEDRWLHLLPGPLLFDDPSEKGWWPNSVAPEILAQPWITVVVGLKWTGPGLGPLCPTQPSTQTQRLGELVVPHPMPRVIASGRPLRKYTFA